MKRPLAIKDLPQRTLPELAAIYRLEPTTKDVIVEGKSDKCLVGWFLEEGGIDKASIYEISNFRVDAPILEKQGVENNNRGRVIALAHELDAIVGGRSCLTAIADADFDIVLKKSYTARCLLLTDYTCMEMYAFSARVISKYLRMHLRNFPKTARYVVREIKDALEQLFIIRLVNSTRRLNLESVFWERSLKLVGTGVQLDVNDYLLRYLNKNSRSADMSDFLEQMALVKKQLTSDPRNQVQGHDFINLLSWYIAQHKGFHRPDPEMLERALFTAAADEALKKEGMFSTLLARLGD